jgi:hypothetical protein
MQQEFILPPYSPYLVSIAYMAIRDKYFSNPNRGAQFRLDRFEQLAKYLEHEKIHYQKYFNFVFGILDLKYPPSPEKLADPLMVLKFREMTR